MSLPLGLHGLADLVVRAAVGFRALRRGADCLARYRRMFHRRRYYLVVGVTGLRARAPASQDRSFLWVDLAPC